MRLAWRRPLRALSVGVLAISGIAAGGGVIIGTQILTSGSASATPPACTDSWKTATSGNWDTAANWSGGHAPGSTDVACITIAGTYTVTYQPAGGTETVDALVVGSGVATNQETLDIQGTCGDNVTLTTTNASSGTDTDLIASTGHVSLTSTGCGNSSTLAVGSTLVNQGTLSTDSGAGGPRTLSGGITNDGTVNVNLSVTYNTGTWDNAGALNLATGEDLTVSTSPATFTDDTGGSVVSTGSSPTGQLVIAGGNTYNQGNGTTSGEPVLLNGPATGGAIALHYTGTGASTIVAQGGAGTVDGTIASGQTLNVNGTCSVNAVETVDASETNSGVVNLTSSGCGNSSTLTVTSGDTFTNHAGGTLETSSGATGARTINGNVTNDGTVNVNLSVAYNSGTWDNAGALNLATGETLAVSTSPATFTDDTGGSVVSTGTGQLVIDGGNIYNQGNGTTSGQPVLLSGPASGGAIALHYTGIGASTIVAQGGAGTVDGSIVAGQTLSVNGTCSVNALETVDHSESNAGTVHLTSSSCGNNSELSVTSGDTLTNQAAGIVDIDAGAGGARTIAGNVTNKGTVNDNANATWTAGTWTNSGALNLATGITLSVPNTAPSTFNNTTNGVVAATGTGLLNVAGGNTFDQGVGTTSGTEPVLLAGPSSGTGVALHYTGTGASVLTTEGTGTVDGTMKTGQDLTVLGFCGLNADEVVDKAMTSTGTIALTSTGCGNNSTLAGKSAKGKDLLTIGKHGILETLSGAGGARTIDDALTLHKGTLDVNANTTYTAEKKGFINSKGTVDIAASTTLTESSVTGSSFANTKGTITGTGELLVEPSDTFNEGAGTITGTNVLLNGANLEYTGSTPGAGTIEAEGVTSLVAGAPGAGQTLDINGTCGLNANLTAVGNVTDLGALELTSSGCGNNSGITEPAGDALTIGSTGSLVWPSGAGGAKSVTGNLVDNGIIGNSAESGLGVSGTLAIGSGGTYAPAVTTGSTDSVTATGGGTLNGTLAPSGTFTANQAYTILNGAFTGSFSTTSGWVVTTSPTIVSMKHA
jgi:fibronectin-binding autotransporter adhesin